MSISSSADGAMRALVADDTGRVRLASRPRPVPEAGEALVRVRAASLNRGELRVVAGQAGAVPGWDVAGELLHDLPAHGLAAGELVAGLATGGAWAQIAAVPAGNLARIPEGVPVERAAALPVAGLTALQALRLGGFLLGRRVLVAGAAGGVGRYAVQLARASGAEVVAVARDGSRAAGLIELGATAVVASVHEAAGRFDLILESAGGDELTAAIERLAPGGDLVAFGSSSDRPGSLDPRAFFNQAPGARIHAYQVFETGPVGDDLTLLLELVRTGRLDPQVDRVVSWTHAEEALADLAERRVNGKTVLRIET